MPLVEIGGRTLSVSNLDKVLYPEAGFTKAQVIDYYARVAPVLLAHLGDRGLTMRRFPNGVDAASFFEKRCPKHRPDWVGTALGPGDRGGPIGYCVLDSVAAVVWAANLAALELHAPMARAVDIESPTMVVFDLDPGEPAAMTECCQVALDIREVLAALGLQCWPKTSGSKGLQLYLPLNSPATHDEAKDFALAVAQLLEKRQPQRVTSEMTKAIRPNKVFIDWSQNSRHKTTIGVYSLRARPYPTVSTPVSWDEVEASAAGRAELRFLAEDVLARVADRGDLFAPTATLVQALPRLG
ncbi:MAG: non-homologous end-joining DNA ligase [Acidimicrobiales bacterium]